jgi:predicted ATPase
VKALKRRKFKFEPGLNIIIGPNGSGKTTLTRTLAKMFYAEQGGRPMLTHKAFLGMYKGMENRYLGDSLEVEHDGGAVFYMNSGDKVGEEYGQVDWDLGTDGLVNFMDKGSAGQMTCHWFIRIGDIIEQYHKGEIEAIDDKLGGRCNDVYQGYVDNAKAFMRPDRQSRTTLILDEPESSVDLLQEVYLWKILKDAATRMQLIVCTHSSFVLNMKGVNFVEMEKGYRKKCLKALEDLEK